MNRSKLLITASTGNIGLPLSKALHEKGIPFTSATRNPDKAFEKFGFETETVPLDYTKPSGFPEALKGVETMFLCGPSATPGADKMLLKLVEQAIDSGVKYFIFIASYPNVMDRIEKSGKDYTFLRGNFFMQNFEMYQTKDIREHNRLFLPTGKGKAPYVDTIDIGQVAAEVIDNPAEYKNDTIYLTGPEAMDLHQVAGIFSDVLGKKITFNEPSDEAYREEMKNRGYSDKYIDAMISVFGKIKKGEVAQTSDDIEKILGRKPGSLKNYIERNKGLFN
ncbi:MAG TPA: NmrA family NAD(P)-binding protein [Bacteroidales bacterium]|nr:NmrA family NAD(P)-binding protein [Bacteroidales bacterium]